MPAELELGDTGTYAELRLRSNTADHALIFIPSLASLLERAREISGIELSALQSRKIRDAAIVIALPREMAVSGAEERGYADIDPESLDAET
jgi:hypothetical protein